MRSGDMLCSLVSASFDIITEMMQERQEKREWMGEKEADKAWNRRQS